MFLLIPWNNMINADTCFLVTQKVWYLYSLKQEYAILLSIKYYFLNMMFREGNGNLLQYSCLENPRTEEPGRLQSTGSLRVGHDWVTSLSLFTFMHWRRKWQPTPVLAWRIPGTRKPGGLPSMGSHRVGHDWSNLAANMMLEWQKNRYGYLYDDLKKWFTI